jgi:hypothetical protein
LQALLIHEVSTSPEGNSRFFVAAEFRLVKEPPVSDPFRRRQAIDSGKPCLSTRKSSIHIPAFSSNRELKETGQ